VTAAHARAAAPTWADAGATSTAPDFWKAAQVLRSIHPHSQGVKLSASTARADRRASTATSLTTAERPRRPPHHRRHRRRRCRRCRHRRHHLHPWTAVRSCPSVAAAAVTAAHARAAAPTWADAGATITAPADWTAAQVLRSTQPHSQGVTGSASTAWTDRRASTATHRPTVNVPRRVRRVPRRRRHRPWTAARSCPSVAAAAVTAAHARAAAPTWADAGATSTAPADWTAARMLRSTHPPSRGVTGSASTARADRGASTATSPRTALSQLCHLRHLHRLCHLYHLHGRLYRLHLHRLHYRLKSAVSAASSECSRADVTATPPCARCRRRRRCRNRRPARRRRRPSRHRSRLPPPLAHRLPPRLLRHRCTPRAYLLINPKHHHHPRTNLPLPLPCPRRFPRLHLRPVPVQSRNRLQPRPWCSPSWPAAM
jgi:hypothetical protein